MKNNLPQRKEIRLKNYDYSIEGYYFITICIKDKLQLLGKFVGVAPQGDPQIYKIKLSREGKIIDKYINNYNKKINNIKIDEYIIMPNHIHFIMVLTKRVALGCDPYNS